MARWERAVEWLGPAPRRVLDVGCAFGHGTALLARRHRTVGCEASAGWVARAARSNPAARFVQADAVALPFAAESFDAAVMLDVLEHVADDRRALAEVARVVRPGGLLVLSVPNRGRLRRLDSLNVWARLARRFGWPPPEAEGVNSSAWHRHYSQARVRSLLGERWAVERSATTAFGVAEVVHLLGLVLSLGLLRSRPLYRVLRYLYFGAYIAEDVLPVCGGYHLTVLARRLPDRSSAPRRSRDATGSVEHA